MTVTAGPRFVEYEGRVFTVASERYQIGDGDEFARDVIHATPSVAIVPLHSSGVVTLVNQFRAPMWDGLTNRPHYLYELPAGKIDNAEPPATAARRELQEELGWKADSVFPLGCIHTSPGITDELIHIFLASNWEPVESDPQGPEELAMHTMSFDLDRALDMTRTGHITDAKTIIGLNWAERLVR